MFPMIIHTPLPKSKQKKKPKHVRQQYTDWLAEMRKPAPQFAKNGSVVVKKIISPKVPAGRETPYYPSVNTGFVPCTKPVDINVYTGEKIIGIGTLHKSNAVPVFNDEEAKDIAKMRRS